MVGGAFSEVKGKGLSLCPSFSLFGLCLLSFPSKPKSFPPKRFIHTRESRAVVVEESTKVYVFRENLHRSSDGTVKTHTLFPM